ncbi:MAG: ATP-dependent RecD-like DNA helicase [Clostridia bacterium]|nr:ATP-dependent RecD-like DNA helicase [Clostridia bacterium]
MVKVGKITKEIFRENKTGYTIAIMETGGGSYTVKGNLPVLHIGSIYELKGTFKKDPKYGEQFVFTHGEEVQVTKEAAIEGFLSSGYIYGVGPKIARDIVSQFKEDSLKIIEEDPMRLTVIPGIGEKKAEEIGMSFSKEKDYAKVAIFFLDNGIGFADSRKIYEVYGLKAIDQIKDDPYKIIDDVEGIGFVKIDAIAMKMGFSENDPLRIDSAIMYILKYYEQQGSTYFPEDELKENVANYIDVTREEVEDAIESLAILGEVHLDIIDGVKVVYIYEIYQAEKQVTAKLVQLNEAEPEGLNVDIDGKINSVNFGLSENQKYAVKNSLLSGVTIITGGPGTGKTTIINTIIQVLMESGLKPLVAAPTGRAAKRVTETSGHYASTIHRLLGFHKDEQTSRMVFQKNENDQLDCDAIVVDEASMIDIYLMNALLKAIKPGTRLILVGDVDQLPSVGPGRVLQDMIDSEYINYVKLTEIFRQAQESDIVVNAHRINRGDYPYCGDITSDFYLIKKQGDDEIAKTLVEEVQTGPAAFLEGIDRMKDVQVITPTKKGLLGTEELNKVLQNAINPPKDGLPEKGHFRQGDKVMQIKNDYELSWRKKGDFTQGEGIFNGEVGYIISIDNDKEELTVVFDDERYATYEFARLEELELAYAITVHKSQGSEYPVVIMPVANFSEMLSNRNLLYTAVTRGKETVVLIGSEDRMKYMVDNNKIAKRYSGLRDRLQKMIEAI